MKYDNLVISGGGIKGISALGLLHKYYEAGLYDYNHISEFVGTSIGAVISLLLNVGYLPMEVFQELYKIVNFFSYSPNDNILSVFKQNGLISIKSFSVNIEKLVRKKLGYIPTFKQLYEQTGKKLTTVAYNLSREREIHHLHLTHPNLLCIRAIEMSSNIPLVFKNYYYHGEEYVDGGLVNNCPVDLVKNSSGKTLVLVLNDSSKTYYNDQLPILKYYHRCLLAPIRKITQMNCLDAPPNTDIVCIYTDDIPIVSMNLSSQEKMRLFLLGYKTGELELKKEKILVKNYFPRLLCNSEEDENWNWE